MKKKSIALFLVLTLLISLSAVTVALGSNYSYDYEGFSKWCEENPDVLEQLRNDEPPLWQYYGYDSKEKLLEAWEITQEEYDEYVLEEVEWRARDYFYEEMEAKERAEFRISHGGTPSGFAVMLNGRYLDLTATPLETTPDGRMMAPCRGLMESVGAVVSYSAQSNLVSADYGDIHIELTVGDDIIYVTRDGKTESMQMDCAAYVKDGSTYIPVRFVFEAIGYDVMWDSEYQTVVVFDKDAIIADLDKNYTIVNKLFVTTTQDDKTHLGEFDMDMICTMFNTLDGDTTSKVNMNITVVQNGDSFKVDASFDAMSFLSMMSSLSGEYLSDDELSLKFADMPEFSGEMIYNKDEGKVYVKGPIMKVFDPNLSADVWYWFEVEDAENMYESITGVSCTELYNQMSNTTMGQMIYEQSLGVYTYFGTVGAYDAIYETDNTIRMFLGDNAFKKNGNTYTMNINKDNCAKVFKALYGEEGEAYAKDFCDEYKEFEISLKITDNADGATVSGSFNMRQNVLYSYTPDMRISGTFDISQSEGTFNITMHVKNMAKVEFIITLKEEATSKTVPTAPPAGSTVISIDELYGDSAA